MFSFLKRDLPAVGRVLFPGAVPPPLGSLGVSPDVTWTPTSAAPEQVWAAQATHPKWGTADLACDRQSEPLPDVIVDHVLSLSDAEKQRARLGQAAITVRVPASHRHALRDRKRLPFWLRTVLKAGGVVAIDMDATLLWSAAMLEDELAHDADLDIESLYVIHAVHDEREPGRATWLHTHGLAALRAFDVDVLEPSPLFARNCGDAFRALAFGALEGAIQPDTNLFELAYPGGGIRLVPVEQFHAQASPEHQRLRELDSWHGGPRAVVCEPAGGLLARWRTRPMPSRFLSGLKDEGFVVPFSIEATELMSERARQTLGLFNELRAEFDSLTLPAVVKLGYEVDGGGVNEREHLWFEVHRIAGDNVDATLANEPHRVPGLKAGERREHGLDRLTDWAIMSPEGMMTPRNISAARRLRETRSMWQARIDAANQSG
jgi:hypothetical protein